MVTQAHLKSVLSYDPETGEFVWTAKRRSVRVGGVCGRINRYGYREIGVGGALHQAHRLAFLYMTGEMPPSSVDHINGKRDDNRWCNLRAATQSQNMANVGVRRTNSSGIPGVVWDRDRNKWRAQLRIDGRKKNLGRFDTVEEARVAVFTAAREQWGDFAGWAKP